MQYDVKCIDDVGHIEKVPQHSAITMDTTEEYIQIIMFFLYVQHTINLLKEMTNDQKVKNDKWEIQTDQSGVKNKLIGKIFERSAVNLLKIFPNVNTITASEQRI